MGTAQNIGSTLVNNVPEETVFNFKPFKLIVDSYEKRFKRELKCYTDNRKIPAPKPRSGHRIVCDDVNMYSFGGYNPSLGPSDEADLARDSFWLESKPLFRELWKFNISSGSWKRLIVEQIPNVLASNAALLSGSVLMVYGGTGVPFGANCSNDLYICDIASSDNPLKFNLISATGYSPHPQYGQAIALSNHYLYTIGGTTGFEYTCDVHRLNLRDGIWEAVYTCKGSCYEPAGRYRHEVALYDNKIYVLGGGTAHETFDFKTIFAFNLLTCLWERVSCRPDDTAREGFPMPRRCHSSVQHDHYTYVVGGFTGRMILRDIWRLDLKTFEWTKFHKFSLARGLYFHSSCLTPSGKFITFGGNLESPTSTRRSATVHTAWLCIPKLKEICWEAVMFYHPDIGSLSEIQLLSLGLPHEFIERLDLPKSQRPV